MSHSKLSVIIPVYGVEKYIEKCAVSLFSQTLSDIEYIFVNDCTPDNSMGVLNHVISKFPERENYIKIINHDVNKGLPAARKTGILAATGEYIIHCDSDDWVSEDLYEKLYLKITANNADVAVCDIIQVGDCEHYKKIKGSCGSNFEVFMNDVIRMKVTWSLVNKLFRRSLYSDEIIYPTDYMGEDMALCLQLLTACDKFCYIEDAHYFYLANFSSESRKEDKESIVKLYDMFAKNYNIVINHFRKSGLYNKYINDLLYTCFKCKMIFVMRARSLSIVKHNIGILPITSLSVVKDRSLSLFTRLQAFFFYLLKL